MKALPKQRAFVERAQNEVGRSTKAESRGIRRRGEEGARTRPVEKEGSSIVWSCDTEKQISIVSFVKEKSS